jgi:hypothetical protein
MADTTQQTEVNANARGAASSGDGASEGGLAPLPADFLVLSLEDLLPDPRGEVVVFDDIGEGLAIVTDHQVADHGVSPAHITAAGVDVDGFSFCTFDTGLTVYYPNSLKLIVAPDIG